jgi:uncharacterized protein (TIGR02145 family)
MKRLLLTLTGVLVMMTVFAQDLSVRASKGYTLKPDAPAIGATSYTWYEDGKPLLDSNSDSYTIEAGTRVPGTYAYVRKASNAECPGGVASNTFIVRVCTNQEQGNCTYTETAPVSTFANFHNTSVYNSSTTYTSLTDERDNKVYPVVKINNRWIMARNLNYQGTNGATTLTWQAESKSPSTVSGSGSATIGSFWCPGKDGTTSSARANCDVWGALYSWETAMMVDGSYTSNAHNSGGWSEPSSYGSSTGTGNTQNHARSDRGICPEHWHVPTDGEWGDLLNAMEPNTQNRNHNSNYDAWIGAVAGSYSKSTCVCGAATYCDTDNGTTAVTSWYGTSSTAGSDEYGFRVLPSGIRANNGSNFSNRGSYAYFWSSSAYDGSRAWYRAFTYREARVDRYYYRRSYGFSVRCIRD